MCMPYPRSSTFLGLLRGGKIRRPIKEIKVVSLARSSKPTVEDYTERLMLCFEPFRFVLALWSDPTVKYNSKNFGNELRRRALSE